MRDMFLSRCVLALGSVAVRVVAESYFFNNTDFDNQVTGISSACSSAMQAPIACDPYLRDVMTNNYYGPVGTGKEQDSFCKPSCGSGLATYRSAVISACSKDPDPLPGLPANYWVDSATSAWTQLCLKDSSTGRYCVDSIGALFANSNDDTDGTELPQSQLCSNCVVSLFRHMQSTAYSNYDDSLASVWSSIQKSCGLSFPTAVQPLDTNLTTPGGFAAPGTGFTGLCLSGKKYVVASGDNCEAIARKNNVATGTLIAVNSLFRDCTNLQAGAELCIPPACTAYVVKNGDTCDAIAAKTSTTFQQLVAWNPSIGSYCTYLVAGQNICVSPPGGPKPLTTIAGATVTQTAIFATATTARPAPVASGTTRRCGDYYQIQPGDFCQLIAINKTIDIGLFKAINPQINSECTNLLAGFHYCVKPTEDWNGIGTPSSTTVQAPDPTPSGTTSNCFEFYIIQPADSCSKLQDEHDISFAQLRFWNPSLKADCSNLLLGEAYCVNGADKGPAGGGGGGVGRVRREEGRGERVRREEGGKVKKRDISTTEENKQVEGGDGGGGVPIGWPLLNAPRIVQMEGGRAKSEL